ncbi:unnamed protein product [Auanema sp. JU1783]|nr:unnamed protein product [Auanema sp. JU1783]
MYANDWIQININEAVGEVNIFDLSVLLEELGLNRLVIMRVPIPNLGQQSLKSSYIQINIYGVSIRFIIEEMHIDLGHSLSTIGINHFFMQDMTCMDDLPVPMREDTVVSCFRTSTPIPDYLPQIDQTCNSPSVSDYRLPEFLYEGCWNSELQPKVETLKISEQLYTQQSQIFSLVDEEVLNCMEDILQMVSEDEYQLNDLEKSEYCSFASAVSSPREDITYNEICTNNSLFQITGFSSVFERLKEDDLGAASLEEVSLSIPNVKDGAEIYNRVENQASVGSTLEEYFPDENSNSNAANTTTVPQYHESFVKNSDDEDSDSDFLKPKRRKKLWVQEDYFKKFSQRHTAFCYRKNCEKRLSFSHKTCYARFSEHARQHYQKPLYKCSECRFRDYIRFNVTKHFRQAHKYMKNCKSSSTAIDIATSSDIINIEKLTRKCFPHYFAEYFCVKKKAENEKIHKPADLEWKRAIKSVIILSKFLINMKSILGLLLLVALAAAMPFDHDAKVEYDDSFARNKILPICSATENDNPAVCLNNRFTNAELKRRHKVFCSKYLLDHCIAYSAVLHDDKAIVLAFKGTQGAAQLILESEETIFANHTAWVAGGTVSKYFSDGFFTLWNHGLKEDYLSLKNKYPDYQLWIAGHSLGGAMASLAASYIVHTQLAVGDNVRLVTFGQPRTGDRTFTDTFDKEIAYSFRLIHAKDVVPHLPPNHVEQYHHHHSEVFYNNDMTTATYVVCRTDEDLFCSDGKIDTSVTDHTHYFNKDVTDWGVQGCV